MNSICPICLSNIKDRGKVILKCNHQMHLKCYLESLKHAIMECPLCKKSIADNKKYFKFLNSKFETVIKEVKNKFTIDKLIDFFEKD